MIRKFYSDEYGIALAILLIALIVHLALLKLMGVNLEFAFVDAARYFQTSNPALIDQFFYYEANTLGLPYLAYLAAQIFPNVETLILIRIINMIGLILLFLGAINICRFLEVKHYAQIMALLIFNPLVWAYSGRATSDFLPVALGVYSISLALGNRHNFCMALLSGLLLGFSCVLKYHTLSLLFFLFALLTYKHPFKVVFNKMLVIIAVSGSVLTLYLILVKANFGFWFAPQKFKEIHGVTFSNVLGNFVLYTGFLGVLVLPTFFLSKVIYVNIKTHWRFIIPTLLFVIFFGIYFFSDNGELNFGPLDRYLDEKFRVIILSTLFLLPILLMTGHQEIHCRRGLGISLLIVILLFSCTRPAQRYLLFIIPFFIFLVPTNIIKSKIIILSAIFSFVLVNSIIELNRFSTGVAAEKMVRMLQIKKILERTDPGAIEAHVGNKFFNTKGMKKSYLVVSGLNGDAIFSVSSGFGFYKKTYSLEKVD